MHIGKDNRSFGFQLEESWLQTVGEERYLGVVVDKCMKFTRQCLETRNRANRALGFININVSYKSEVVLFT